MFQVDESCSHVAEVCVRVSFRARAFLASCFGSFLALATVVPFSLCISRSLLGARSFHQWQELKSLSLRQAGLWNATSWPFRCSRPSSGVKTGTFMYAGQRMHLTGSWSEVLVCAGRLQDYNTWHDQCQSWQFPSAAEVRTLKVHVSLET